MNNTHGDILYSPNITVNEPISNDLLYRLRPENTTAGSSSGVCHSPRGEVGWICPVCGRGLAPSTSYCPCILTKDITYLNSNVTIKDILDNAIDSNSTPPEAYHTTTTNTSK